MTTISKRKWTTKDGRVHEAYRVPVRINGKRKFRQFPTRSGATAFLHSLTKYVETTERKLNDPLISVVAADWLQSCRDGPNGEAPLEPETIKVYENYVRNHINVYFRDRHIGTIKRTEVKAFRTHLLNAGIQRITAKKILVALRSIFVFALDQETITTNPTQGITIKLGGRHTTHVTIPSKDEMTRLITSARRLAASKNKRIRKAWIRYSLMLELLVYCGLRLSELRGLPRKSINLKTGTIEIKQRADRAGRIGPPKSVRSRRRLYMPETLIPRLAAWLESHDFDLVFPSENGLPMAPENIRKRMWDKILTEAKVPPYNIHTTRHFYASRLIESNPSAKEVSVALGHADEGFTLRVYGHLFHDDETEQRRRDRVNDMVLA